MPRPSYSAFRKSLAAKTRAHRVALDAVDLIDNCGSIADLDPVTAAALAVQAKQDLATAAEKHAAVCAKLGAPFGL